MPHSNEKNVEEGKHLREVQLRNELETEERRKREEAEIVAKAVATAAEEERLRLEAVELARRKEAEEERFLRKVEETRLRSEAEEERLRQQAEEEERLRHQAAEVEAAVQANKRIAEVNHAQEVIKAWCKTHGYKDVMTPKTTLRGNKKYVLHTAVKHEDSAAIKLLLLLGAQKDAKDSKGQTALQLAQKIDSEMRREVIVAALC